MARDKPKRFDEYADILAERSGELVSIIYDEGKGDLRVAKAYGELISSFVESIRDGSFYDKSRTVLSILRGPTNSFVQKEESRNHVSPSKRKVRSRDIPEESPTNGSGGEETNDSSSLRKSLSPGETYRRGEFLLNGRRHIKEKFGSSYLEEAWVGRGLTPISRQKYSEIIKMAVKEGVISVDPKTGAIISDSLDSFLSTDFSKYRSLEGTESGGKIGYAESSSDISQMGTDIPPTNGRIRKKRAKKNIHPGGDNIGKKIVKTIPGPTPLESRVLIASPAPVDDNSKEYDDPSIPEEISRKDLDLTAPPGKDIAEDTSDFIIPEDGSGKVLYESMNSDVKPPQDYLSHQNATTLFLELLNENHGSFMDESTAANRLRTLRRQEAIHTKFVNDFPFYRREDVRREALKFAENS